MFCPNCGSVVEDNAKFCPTCGAVLPHDDSVSPQQEKPQESAQSQSVDNSPFGAAYENQPQTNRVDNSPFGAAYETPESMRQYNNNQPQYNNGVNNQPQYNPQQNASTSAPNNNTLALVGFILSFFVPIAGLICSIIGLKNAGPTGNRKGMAIAGIIISAVQMVINFIMIITGYYDFIFEMLYSLYDF